MSSLDRNLDLDRNFPGRSHFGPGPLSSEKFSRGKKKRHSKILCFWTNLDPPKGALRSIFGIFGRFIFEILKILPGHTGHAGQHLTGLRGQFGTMGGQEFLGVPEILDSSHMPHMALKGP